MPRFPHLRLPGKGCSGLEWAVGCLGRHITQSHSAGWGRFAAGTPQLCSQNRCFLHLPRRCLGVAAPLCPSPGILRVASLCPICLLHPRVLPACLPTPPLLCKHPPPSPEAFASPDSVASRNDGSSVQAGKPHGTSTPAAALPIPAAASVLGCAIEGEDPSWSPRVGWGWRWWDASGRARNTRW